MSPYRLLVVEDAPESQKLVHSTLRPGFDLVFASTVREALSFLERHDFDLVLLDVVLPDGEGFKVCSFMQGQERLRSVPIVFLTSRALLSDKLLGFSMGADDYVTKPYEPLELRVRIETKLKKVAENRRQAEVVHKGHLTLDLSLQRAFLEESSGCRRDLDLTAKEFKLLAYLVLSESRILNREDLLTRVWGDEVSVSDRTVDAHISKVRKKLGEHADYIHAVYGSGYYFSSRSALSADASADPSPVFFV